MTNVRHKRQIFAARFANVALFQRKQNDL